MMNVMFKIYKHPDDALLCAFPLIFPKLQS